MEPQQRSGTGSSFPHGVVRREISPENLEEIGLKQQKNQIFIGREGRECPEPAGVEGETGIRGNL